MFTEAVKGFRECELVMKERESLSWYFTRLQYLDALKITQAYIKRAIPCFGLVLTYIYLLLSASPGRQWNRR